MLEVLDSFRQTFKDVLVGKGMTEEAMRTKVDAVTGQLNALVEKGEAAAGEPTLWHEPWRPALFAGILSTFVRLNALLLNFVSQVRDERAHLLDKLPNYPKVCDELIGTIDRTCELAAALLKKDTK